MIIARAPLRVSFLGGITDFPDYFEQEGKVGHVLGATIDKWVNVMVAPQPEFESVRFRFTYRVTEAVNHFEDINHPVMRNVLKMKDWTSPLNVATMADLPGRSGLGSSSAFTVALLAALRSIDSPMKLDLDSRLSLAREAIFVERHLIGEAGGVQDQYQASLGGFRHYQFTNKRTTGALIGTVGFREYLGESLVLVATGGGRDSNQFATITQSRVKQKSRETLVDELSAITGETALAINCESDHYEALLKLGRAMNEAWKIKIELSGHQRGVVDDLLEYGQNAGAIGGKLCGAGGSGFAAFLVDPADKVDFMRQFDSKDLINTGFSNEGVEIIDAFSENLGQ